MCSTCHDQEAGDAPRVKHRRLGPTWTVQKYCEREQPTVTFKVSRPTELIIKLLANLIEQFRKTAAGRRDSATMSVVHGGQMSLVRVANRRWLSLVVGRGEIYRISLVVDVTWCAGELLELESCWSKLPTGYAVVCEM